MRHPKRLLVMIDYKLATNCVVCGLTP